MDRNIRRAFVYNPATKIFRQYLNNPRDSSSLSANSVTDVKQDKQGIIWVGTEQGLSRLHPDGSGFRNYAHKEADTATISSSLIHCIGDGEDGTLWVGTERGLNILDIKTGAITKSVYDYRNVHGLTSEGIKSIYIDRRGICWLGTIRGGINKYDRNLNLFNLISSNPFDPFGLNAPVVTSFAEQQDGQIFVGTEGGGLCLFDPRSKQFKHINLRSQRPGSDNHLVIRSLKITTDNRLLIGTISDGLFVFKPYDGTYKQLLRGNRPDELNSNEIYCIREDSKGNWWLGTNGAGIDIMNKSGRVICRYTPTPTDATDKKLPFNGFIRDIVEDNDGEIWIATHGGGMAKYNLQTSSFTVYTTMNSRLPNDKVLSVLQDHRGYIWACTFGGGLCEVNKKTGKLSVFSEEEGLQNNSVYKIVEDHAGLLWVSSNKGLSSLEPVSKKINNYNYYNGVQRNNFFPGAGLLTKSGAVYFGGLEGFNYINPQYLRKNENIPAVILTDLKISNQSVSPSTDGPINENISVAHEINLGVKQNFALSYVGLNYTAPGQNQYAYKLDGFDKDWNFVGSSTVAHYTNLDPGSYIFRIKASNNDGIWSKGNTTIRVIIHPPFWRTLYAYVFYGIFFASLVLYLRHKSIEKIKRRFKLEQVRKEEERLHEIDQLKIKFLTNLSHEFRTPISLILGPLDKLISQEENVWRSAHLKMIKRNGKRLLNLVNQLLDFRKMEEHELKLQTTEGELISFVRDVFDSFRDLAERKKIAFIFHPYIDNLSVWFDRDKIERILFNLLSNAFKFTLEGGRITLLVEQTVKDPRAPDKVWVLIKVTDSGIGIAPDKKEKIFERFFQNATSASILNQGSGIGLSITKEFVSMHGGKIEVESEEGKGTSFKVYLPFTCRQYSEIMLSPAGLLFENSVQEPLARQPDIESKADVPEASNLPALLLVEDNDDFRFYLKENLRLYYKVFEAANGKEGWQKALSVHPQLIVSDISMPYMDGIELCKKLKADKRTNHIPVILLTALTGEKEQLKGLETGANDYITKPFNFELLNSKIKNLLTLKDTFKSTFSRQINVLVPTQEVQPENEKLLGNLMLYLEENLADKQLSVEMISRHLGMSRSTLYNKLFELTGQTPVEYIRSIKLDKAMFLLEKSNMNIAQIAYSVGFATPKYFAKSFKAKFNILPSDYINKKRKMTSEKKQ